MNLNYPTRSDHYNLINVFNANFSEIATKTINGDTIYGGTIFSDLNAITKNTRGTCYGSATGSPGSSYSWFIDHNNSNVGTVTAYQRAVAYSTSLIVAERVKMGSVWGAWVFNYASTISETPTASNLGTITTHKVMRNGGSIRYKLEASTGTWVAGNSYNICSISAPFRPSVPIGKIITIRTDGDVARSAYFYISTGGTVGLNPKNSMAGVSISIDETFIV